MKAMIFAAGLGTRLKPFTNSKPKALAEINGISLLEIAINRLIRFGFDEIIINVHHFPNQIIDFLKSKNNFGIQISVSDETGVLLDTGGGLKKAAHFFNDGKPFLVHNVDIVSNIDLEHLYATHLRNNCLATLACMERVSSRQLLINSKNELCGWKNNATGEVKISKEHESFLKAISFCGIQVISNKLLNLILEDGSFSLITLYLRLASNNCIMTENFENITWIDLGTPETLQKACGLKKELEL
jgi:MurNAc alpha-1-phosphate uridylyltransferase